LGVATGRWTFSEALDRLMRYALKMGAIHVTDLWALEDYLSTALADFAMAGDP
jgi:hypothetical protein